MSWQQEILDKWNVKYIDSLSKLPEGVLWTSRCSKTKKLAGGLPKNLYVSSLNIKFYECMEKYGLRYAILSDLYGIHFDDEKLAYYDIHPSSLTAEEKERLGKIIGEKTKGRGYSKVVFYNSSPLMSRPYFEMLSHSGLEVYFVTRLDLWQPHYEKGNTLFNESNLFS